MLATSATSAFVPHGAAAARGCARRSAATATSTTNSVRVGKLELGHRYPSRATRARARRSRGGGLTTSAAAPDAASEAAPGPGELGQEAWNLDPALTLEQKLAAALEVGPDTIW
jgi:hypothetical protein